MTDIFNFLCSDRDLDRRRSLRKDFWTTIDEYLTNLECPQSYMTTDAKVWRTCRALRGRIVYWLISCAVSESYAENVEEDDPDRTNGAQSILEGTQLDSLALGFTTGDDAVDRILKLVRMQNLLGIEQQQRRQNDLLAKKIQQRMKEQGKKDTNIQNKPSRRGKRR